MGDGDGDAVRAQCDSACKVVAQLGWLVVALLVGWMMFVVVGRRRRSRTHRPPVVDTAVPWVGGLLKFVAGPVPLLREQYGRLGSVFTVHILTRRVTFLLGPDVSTHFFKAHEADLSQREVSELPSGSLFLDCLVEASRLCFGIDLDCGVFGFLLQVYQFNVPTFGPGVVFDVDYSVRMEQFRFFAEALTVKRLKSYVTMMAQEAEVQRGSVVFA